MQVKSSPSQQGAVVETSTTDFLVFGKHSTTELETYFGFFPIWGG